MDGSDDSDHGSYKLDPLQQLWYRYCLCPGLCYLLFLPHQLQYIQMVLEIRSDKAFIDSRFEDISFNQNNTFRVTDPYTHSGQIIIQRIIRCGIVHFHEDALARQNTGPMCHTLRKALPLGRD